jgi:hypothetical protein
MNTTSQDAARIAEGLTDAQKRSFLTDNWNVTKFCNYFMGIGLVKRVAGAKVFMNVELTSLGLAVRNYLQEQSK